MANYWESEIQPAGEQPEQNTTQNQLPPYDPDEAARRAQQNFAQESSSASPYAQKPLYGSPTNPPERPRKPRRHGAMVAVFAVCIVLSLCCGFFGAYAANRWFPVETAGEQEGQNSLIEAPLHTDTTSTQPVTSLSSVVDATKVSVVEITTESVTTSNFFGQYVTQGAGSGVIARADGYIITNNHVINGANNIKVTLYNGDTYDATIVGTDSKSDLAVIKIDANDLTPAVFGNSDDVKVGDYVIAIGNPLGSLGGTVTDGIVSALDREILVENQTMTLLQTSAAINPGNSGGGLFNTYGELIGIVNAKPTDSAAGSDSSIDGLGFAIPVDTVKEVVNEIINNGYVTGRPIMGLSVLEINDAQTAYQYGVDRYGVYIVSITEGLGADKAGLQVGDCIVSVNGNAVSSTSDVTTAIEEYAVGDTIEIQVIREGKMLTVDVELTENVPSENQNAG